MSAQANRPAYPKADSFCDGLTKRELFAAMIMQGLFSDNKTLSNASREEGLDLDKTHAALAALSVAAADALLVGLEVK